MEQRRPVLKCDEENGKSQGIDVSLPTSIKKRVQTLQTSLRAKAKAEPDYRFYSLGDKVCRSDIRWKAYHRCHANRGAPGYDGLSFEQIDAQGPIGWLVGLQQELKSGQYRPAPLLRVWIPKANGGQRPLSIPTIKDRVVQMAVLLVMGPIFEEDLLLLAPTISSLHRWNSTVSPPMLAYTTCSTRRNHWMNFRIN